MKIHLLFVRYCWWRYLKKLRFFSQKTSNVQFLVEQQSEKLSFFLNFLKLLFISLNRNLKMRKKRDFFHKKHKIFNFLSSKNLKKYHIFFEFFKFMFISLNLILKMKICEFFLHSSRWDFCVFETFSSRRNSNFDIFFSSFLSKFLQKFLEWSLLSKF